MGCAYYAHHADGDFIVASVNGIQPGTTPLLPDRCGAFPDDSKRRDAFLCAGIDS